MMKKMLAGIMAAFLMAGVAASEEANAKKAASRSGTKNSPPSLRPVTTTNSAASVRSACEPA